MTELAHRPDTRAASDPTNPNKKSSFKNGIKWVAGTTALAAVIGIGGDKLGFFDDSKESAPAGTVAAGEVVPGQETSNLSPETVALIQQFDSRRDQILSDILDGFAKDGYNMSDYHQFEGRKIEAASPDLSAQAIMDRMVAKEHFLTSNPNREEARSQVPLEARPGTQAYGMVEGSIDYSIQTGKPTGDDEAVISSKRFDNGTLIDPLTGETLATAHNTPTVILSGESLRERTDAIRVFQYEQSTDGQTGDWRLIYSKPADKTGFDIHTLASITLN